MSAGGVTVAVLLSVPSAAGFTVPVAVNDDEAPAGRSAVVAMGPLPLVAPHSAPTSAVQVQVTPVSSGGKVSATDAPTTSLGPALKTVMV